MFMQCCLELFRSVWIWRFTAWWAYCNVFLFCFCYCSKMRLQTVRTWALRALIVSVRPSLMKTQERLYPPRCMKMWRRTAALRPRYMTLKMPEIGLYKVHLHVLSYPQCFLYTYCSLCLMLSRLVVTLNDFCHTSSIVIHFRSMS